MVYIVKRIISATDLNGSSFADMDSGPEKEETGMTCATEYPTGYP